jgi:RNA polymerase sigma factor (sigma-70 family)
MVTDMASYTEQDILDNMELIHKIAHFMKARHTNSLIDFDDLVSEGIFGLFTAFRRFDPKKGKWPTHAGRCIKYAMIEAHRQAFKQHRQARRFGLPEPTYLPLDAIEGDEILFGDFLSEEETIDRIDSTLVLKKTWGRLSFRQRHIIKLMLGGMTQGEVSEVMKISPSIVCIQYNKALGKIRDYHLNRRREG